MLRYHDRLQGRASMRFDCMKSLVAVSLSVPSAMAPEPTARPDGPAPRFARPSYSIRFPCIVKLVVWRCCYRKAWIMNALRLVGLAILTVIAPCAILLGSSPAHADTDFYKPCPVEGAKVWGNGGPIMCQRKADGQLQWVPIPAAALCVAFCDRFGGP